MNTSQTKKLVLEYARRCHSEGLVAGTSGNLSQLADGGVIVITPSGMDYGAMGEQDIMVVDFAGNILEGRHKPSSEWRMHARIYEKLPRTRAIVHTHSPYATSFAVVGEPIPAILVEMIPFLGGGVPVAPFARPGTDEVGANAASVMAERHACLMRSHGVTTVGDDLPQAYIRAVYAEEAAKICHLAKSIGTPIIIG